jgi:hypothetical protein
MPPVYHHGALVPITEKEHFKASSDFRRCACRHYHPRCYCPYSGIACADSVLQYPFSSTLLASFQAPLTPFNLFLSYRIQSVL